MNLNRFILGSVQFGQVYGISNKRKNRLRKETIKKIIKKSYSCGIKSIDTAISYENDKILGEIGIKNFLVNSKVPFCEYNKEDEIIKFYEKEINRSLTNLKIKKFHLLMIHYPNQLNNKKGKFIFKALLKLKNKKLFNKIGVSIYDFNQLNRILQNYKFDTIQLPFNIFDRRLLEKDLIKKLLSKRIEIHVRSIFLQGLLLMNKDRIDKKFRNWKNIFLKWDEWANKQNLTKLSACIN